MKIQKENIVLQEVREWTSCKAVFFCFSSKGNLGLNLHSLETLCKLMKCEKWKENSSYKVDGMAKVSS